MELILYCFSYGPKIVFHSNCTKYCCTWLVFCYQSKEAEKPMEKVVALGCGKHIAKRSHLILFLEMTRKTKIILPFSLATWIILLLLQEKAVYENPLCSKQYIPSCCFLANQLLIQIRSFLQMSESGV